MWKIQFHQFRCWENLLIEAPIGSITLIKGNSGIGKTTIFQGITWCLYGNVRLVTPNHLEKAKTRVTIEFPHEIDGKSGIITVDRRKDPVRVILTHRGNTYEDKVAQAIIDELFGNYDIWLASCYIGQGCRNNFLTSPNSGKMELLNSIAFHQEDPGAYITRIDFVITETDIEYKNKLAVFTANLNKVEILMKTADVNNALTPDNVLEINNSLITLNKEIAILRKENTERNVNSLLLMDLNKQLSTIREVPIVVTRPEEIIINTSNRLNIKYQTVEELDESIGKIAEIVGILQGRDQIDIELKRYENMLVKYTQLDKNVKYTNEDYKEAVRKEIEYSDSQKLAQSLSVVYSESGIKETIKKYRNTLAAQERLNVERECAQLQIRINMEVAEQIYESKKVKLTVPDLSSQIIVVPNYTIYSTSILASQITDLSIRQGSLQVHIQHLQKGKDVLQCPECKTSLRYQQGGLRLAEISPVNLEELKWNENEMVGIISEISKIKEKIQGISNNEMTTRKGYEMAVIVEQRRIDGLRQKSQQIELENQRRDITNEIRNKQIIAFKEEWSRKDDKLNKMTERSDGEKLLTNKEIENMNIVIARLETIRIVEMAKVSSQLIQAYINYQEIIDKITKARIGNKEYYDKIPVGYDTELVSTLQFYFEKLRTYRNQVRKQLEEKIRIGRLEESLEIQINKIIVGREVKDEIDTKMITISMLDNKLLASSKAHYLTEFYAIVTKERDDVIALNDKLADLYTLRQHAVETECHILQEVVESINGSIQSVCGTLFDRDISIILNLFKTMKGNDNIKPIANFNISYQGGTFDNINQMSGGEGDRASLALTLALNRLSSCPLLMLDESLASLDMNMKEAAIKTIRENTNNTVLIIMHDGIEGLYQNVVDIDTLRSGRY